VAPCGRGAAVKVWWGGAGPPRDRGPAHPLGRVSGHGKAVLSLASARKRGLALGRPLPGSVPHPVIDSRAKVQESKRRAAFPGGLADSLFASATASGPRVGRAGLGPTLARGDPLGAGYICPRSRSRRKG
jgi:hypothetical protein